MLSVHNFSNQDEEVKKCFVPMENEFFPYGNPMSTSRFNTQNSDSEGNDFFL
jgi:hypothetical protein